ncbi:hypothetical protein [Thiomicrorhabdus lithotrophica]|uniref:Uncharacterized protein n=1 Tax=Thiomicrorhabdus lithotrophica TaxID=2949997 RepID=A0ABY8C855_9GAMM|nr:hypothetical protein [Thiomicrorhabdus lithotrophica]WEJ62150.1 hypothetical protein NR989_09030 [Thiomicrorhabdus lithotrophica]
MNADLQAYLEGSDDILMLGINLQAGVHNRWFCDQLEDMSVTVGGVVKTLEARACLAMWPKRMGNGDFSTSVQIDDVDDEISGLLTNHGFSEVNVDLYLFLESHKLALGSLMQPVLVMPFRAESLSADGSIANFSCKRPDIINKKYPVDLYEPDKYPGLEAV